MTKSKLYDDRLCVLSEYVQQHKSELLEGDKDNEFYNKYLTGYLSNYGKPSLSIFEFITKLHEYSKTHTSENIENIMSNEIYLNFGKYVADNNINVIYNWTIGKYLHKHLNAEEDIKNVVNDFILLLQSDENYETFCDFCDGDEFYNVPIEEYYDMLESDEWCHPEYGTPTQKERFTLWWKNIQ